MILIQIIIILRKNIINCLRNFKNKVFPKRPVSTKMNHYASIQVIPNISKQVPRLYPDPIVLPYKNVSPSAPEQITTVTESINHLPESILKTISEISSSPNTEKYRKVCSCKGDCTKASGCGCAKNERKCISSCHKNLENKNCTRCNELFK